MSSHSFFHFYLFASIFPILSLIVAWSFFYGFDHYTSGRILPISETVLQSPESRIFAATMNFEALLLLCLYLLRNRIISLYHKRQLISSFGWTLRTFCCRVCTFIVPLGLCFVCSVTLNELSSLHLIGAALFFGGSIIYYLMSDYSLSVIGFRPSILSRSLSWNCFIWCLLYLLFHAIGNLIENPWIGWLNVSAIFQYFTGLTLFIKILLFYWDVPNHYFCVVPIGPSN
jgi:hypothetical protein